MYRMHRTNIVFNNLTDLNYVTSSFKTELFCVSYTCDGKLLKLTFKNEPLRGVKEFRCEKY